MKRIANIVANALLGASATFFALVVWVALSGGAVASRPPVQVEAGPGSPVARPFDSRESWLVRCAQQDDGQDTAVLLYEATVDEVRVSAGELRTKDDGKELTRDIEVGQFCVVAHGFQVR